VSCRGVEVEVLHGVGVHVGDAHLIGGEPVPPGREAHSQREDRVAFTVEAALQQGNHRVHPATPIGTAPRGAVGPQ
jgi:hypothetical protein